MSALAPNLFTRRFRDLLDVGHARLRPLAPEWTDHNAHDPGITVMELLAWVAEAQIYSLSRLRRDERTAFAALLGLTPAGTTAAQGLVWADWTNPKSPARTFSNSVVLGTDTVINVAGDDVPTFRPAHELLWAPGDVTHVGTRHADGHITDHTATNAKGGLVFLPLGETAGPGALLTIAFKSRDERGLFGAESDKARQALWPIGYRSASAAGGAADPSAPVVPTEEAPRLLQATLVTAEQRTPVRIAFDSTANLQATGVLLLDLREIEGSPAEFTIEIRAVRGLARPPRALRIEPNVLPIQQGQTILREPHLSTGEPDMNFVLDVPGLRYSAGESPVIVEVSDAIGIHTWKPGVVQDAGPDDQVFELDARSGRITFGNGVNGRAPGPGANVLVTYAVSDGEQGRVARNRNWRVAGFPGSFGVNVDPIVGSTGSPTFIDERRHARVSSREDHALISNADIEMAALQLPLLEVARAWVVPASPQAPRTGVVRLVAMRSPADAASDASDWRRRVESARWLEAIRSGLAVRMPLGTRLQVVAPRYIDFTIDAQLEAEAGRDPETIKAGADAALNERLALVAPDQSAVREPGVPVTTRDVIAWLRSVDGVRRVIDVQLRIASGSKTDRIAVPANGLPRRLASEGSITVRRSNSGAGA